MLADGSKNFKREPTVDLPNRWLCPLLLLRVRGIFLRRCIGRCS